MCSKFLKTSSRLIPTTSCKCENMVQNNKPSEHIGLAADTSLQLLQLVVTRPGLFQVEW